MLNIDIKNYKTSFIMSKLRQKCRFTGLIKIKNCYLKKLYYRLSRLESTLQPYGDNQWIKNFLTNIVMILIAMALL